MNTSSIFGWSKEAKLMTAFVACLIALCATMAIAPLTAYAENGSSLQAAATSTFAPPLKQVSANRSLTVSGYLNTQGAAFDTYTKKDGYSFAGGSDGNTGYKLVHFTMDANGNIKQVKSVSYAAKNVGHANDATVYKTAGKQYLFVAITGGTELSSKTYQNKDTKIGVIDLDEYNKGTARVHGCTVKVNSGVKMSKTIANCAFSGITYTGTRKVAGKDRAVFVLKDGRTFYAAYTTLSNGEFTFHIFDSARIEKPTITYQGKQYEAATQGVTYHNGYLYLAFSGEKNKLTMNSFLIGRITYSKLFGGTYNDIYKLQISPKRIETTKGVALARHIPEAIFFRTLNSSDNMYLSFNRATTAAKASDIDAVLRSTTKF